MSQPKTACRKCGGSILETTARRYGGLCGRCVTRPEQIVEGFTIGMRLLAAGFFSAMLGLLAFAAGAQIDPLTALFLAVPFGFAGFVYGFFCMEIGCMVHAFFAMWFDS